MTSFSPLFLLPIRFLHEILQLLIDNLIFLLGSTRLQAVVAVHAGPIGVWIIGILGVLVIVGLLLKGDKLVLGVLDILVDGSHRLSVLVVGAGVRVGLQTVDSGRLVREKVLGFLKELGASELVLPVVHLELGHLGSRSDLVLALLDLLFGHLLGFKDALTVQGVLVGLREIGLLQAIGAGPKVFLILLGGL